MTSTGYEEFVKGVLYGNKLIDNGIYNDNRFQYENRNVVVEVGVGFDNGLLFSSSIGEFKCESVSNSVSSAGSVSVSSSGSAPISGSGSGSGSGSDSNSNSGSDSGSGSKSKQKEKVRII